MSISDVFDWFFDNASKVAPVVSAVGGAIAGSNANNEAAKLSREGLNEAADIQAAGIDKALGIDLDTLVLLKQNFGDRFEDVVSLLKQAPADYRQTLVQGLSQYASGTTGAANRYGTDLRTTGKETARQLTEGGAGYGEDLSAIADTLGVTVDELVGRLDANAEKAAGNIKPYAEAGTEALESLRRLSGEDPSKLTASQQRQLDQLKRSSAQRLAASGLRGAGRAGVALANDAELGFRAKAEDENRARVDRAIASLFGTGSGAATALAGLTERTGTQGFNAGLSTADKMARLGETAAGADFDIAKAIAALNQGTGEKIAGNNLTTGNDIAAKNLAANSDYAAKAYGTDREIASQTADFYDRNASLITGEGGSRSRAARETAASRAAARQGTSVTDANAQLANANLYGGAGGALSAIFAKQRQPVPAAATA